MSEVPLYDQSFPVEIDQREKSAVRISGFVFRVSSLGRRVRDSDVQTWGRRDSPRERRGWRPGKTVLNLRATTWQKCEAVPRRARS